MARKKLPKVELCKIRTDRFRDMTPAQIDSAFTRIGGLKTGRNTTRGILSKFLFQLWWKHSRENVRDRMLQDPKAYRFADGRPVISIEDLNKDIVGAERDAQEAERKIWDKQAKAKCKLPEGEIPARDAEREGRQAEADLIRNRRSSAKTVFPRRARPWRQE